MKPPRRWLYVGWLYVGWLYVGWLYVGWLAVGCVLARTVALHGCQTHWVAQEQRRALIVNADPIADVRFGFYVVG